MTIEQWATICTIHVEPSYVFTGTERRVAEGMVRKGWLKRKPQFGRIGMRYTITESGEVAYEQGAAIETNGSI